MPSSTGQQPSSPLVGREREQETLRDTLAAMLAGRGGLVLIGGEAGIGKTTLVDALVHEAAERVALVLTGRCYDLTETPPYGPWLDLFARYPRAEELPSLPAAFAQRGRVGEVTSLDALFYAVQEFLIAVAAQRPLVLFLDDLHWADPASLDLLRFLARDLAAHAILLVATYRADELTRRHPLYALVPLLVREASATRLDLRPLSADAVRSLIADRYHLPDADVTRLTAYLHERAEGNPFFLGELLRTLEADGVLHATPEGWQLDVLTTVRVPPLLRQVIDGRLARMSDDAQRLLTVAAVIGQEIPLALWAMVTDADDETLATVIEEGIEARVLETVPGGGDVRYVHALIREALYEGIVPVWRRTWHWQIGEALATAPNPDPDAVAYHFQRAGDERTVQWLVRAGERAQAAFAWLTAAERYEAAVALMPETGPDAGKRGWLLFRISRMRRWQSAERSIAYLDEALRIAEAADDRALAALARFTRGVVRFAGKRETVEGAAEVAVGVEAIEALTLAERDRLRPYEPAVAAVPRVGLLFTHASTGRYRDILAIFEGEPASLRAPVTADMSLSAVGDGWGHLATAYMMLGRPVAAKAERAHRLERWRATRNDQRLAQILIYEQLSMLAYETDEVQMRRRVSEECDDAWRRARANGERYADNSAWVPVWVLEGRWREARSVIDGARGSEDRRRPFWELWYSPIMLAQGDRKGAGRLVRDLLPRGPATEPGSVIDFQMQRSQQLAIALNLDVDDLPQARAWLDAHDRWLEWSGAVLGQSEGQLLWAQYYRQVGNLEMAFQHAERALAHATEPRQPLALLAAQRLLGELHTDAGHYEDADRHLQASLALADACAAPYERALTLLAMAELAAARGKGDAAQSLLDEVRTICTPLGAKPALARAEAVASRLHAATSRNPDGLSEREVDVLRLIAAGKNNQEVADALSLSVRTIERHITNLYGKIGARGRADAATYALRHLPPA